MFPFWIEVSPSSLLQFAIVGASASWMFLTWLGGARA